MSKTLYCFLLVFIPAALIISGCGTRELTKQTDQRSKDLITGKFEKENFSFKMPEAVKVDSTKIDDVKKQLHIYFSKQLSYIPIREKTVEEIYKYVKENWGLVYSGYDIKIYSLGIPIEELIPNFYRSSISKYDYLRIPTWKKPKLNTVVTNKSKPYEINNGLQNSNIALWHSHGWYYNNYKDRWEWQRPRLFQTVEDLLPMSFTIEYLIPMLENAGANVFVPRERDIQTNEVIVDNDAPANINYSEAVLDSESIWFTGEQPGFAIRTPSYKNNTNPFELGTYRFTYTNYNTTSEAKWTPEIPEDGYYAVYVSYHSSPNSAEDAKYIVKHLGGETVFNVNQTVGGQTWIYLGTFKFKKGKHLQTGQVILSNESSSKGKFISADAIRFGGGMGVIERNGKTSGRPKFLEASRYWLQFAGFPDSLVYNLNKDTSDYKDDYQSRGEYVNYLIGSPLGPNLNRNQKGLGIPIDLSLAFHTNAGITNSDTTFGTLAIYSLNGYDSLNTFPDGISRLANRDLADLIQTQLVDDIRKKYDKTWNRRSLFEANYSESARPNVPSALLELLSHQNFLDMKFALDPNFRFDVSRAIYKAMLKFLSVQKNFNYVVQPLPVTDFSAEFDNSGNVVLKWLSQSDPNEPTAEADKYIVYTKIDNGGFDNGVITDNNFFTFTELKQGKIYSFKVTAINSGGESFPSEILSVHKTKDFKNPVLIINGFDRVAAPASFTSKEFSGFLNFLDAGVPYKYDLNFTGEQFNFFPSSNYQSNDFPGFGNSSSNFETKIIAGNSFDFPFVHGKALKANNKSFVSVSYKAVEDGYVNLNNYKIADLILGEQKSSPAYKGNSDSLGNLQYKTFSARLQNKLKSFLNNNGNLFVSGAYVASDIYLNGSSEDKKFLNDVLKIKFEAVKASKDGRVYPIDKTILSNIKEINFNTELNDSIYAVEAPDAISSVNGSNIFLRYKENEFGAAVAYKNNYSVVTFAFPFETILEESYRAKIMKAILNYFESNKKQTY